MWLLLTRFISGEQVSDEQVFTHRCPSSLLDPSRCTLVPTAMGRYDLRLDYRNDNFNRSNHRLMVIRLGWGLIPIDNCDNGQFKMVKTNIAFRTVKICSKLFKFHGKLSPIAVECRDGSTLADVIISGFNSFRAESSEFALTQLIDCSRCHLKKKKRKSLMQESYIAIQL